LATAVAEPPLLRYSVKLRSTSLRSRHTHLQSYDAAARPFTVMPSWLCVINWLESFRPAGYHLCLLRHLSLVKGWPACDTPGQPRRVLRAFEVDDGSATTSRPQQSLRSRSKNHGVSWPTPNGNKDTKASFTIVGAMKGLLRFTVLLDTLTCVLAMPARAAPAILTATAEDDIPPANATPKPQATAWSEPIPLSTFAQQKRQASSTVVSDSSSHSPTSSVKLGQLVVAGTKVSALPPALCGFFPYNNGKGPDFGRRSLRFSQSHTNI